MGIDGRILFGLFCLSWLDGRGPLIMEEERDGLCGELARS